MIIQPSFGGCLHLRIAIPIDKTTIHWYAPTCGASPKTAEVRFHTLARGWLACTVTPMRTQLPPKCGCRNMLRGWKTAEERFNMLARGWLAYPVTPIAHATTAEERL